MDIKPLDEKLSVTAQPGYDDIDTLAKMGFRTIVSNRPHRETEDQPDMLAFKNRAESLGMVWREIPIKPGEYSKQDIEAFSEVLQTSPAPILGFCRTGKRVSHLWAYSQVREHPIADLMTKARNAGYDLEPLKDELERYAREEGMS
ncbi:MAG: TIGR01244 family phosphatase [Pseudomonadaceae bacterium]|nr:TIGR01244 family phosphatase [Pseudomonadaceae bacterium]|tara:strand:+ start:1228 stop:1665 length:438 start_codon:yes stop_codon:yes gene_type:complete